VRLTLALEEKTDRFLAELAAGGLRAPQAPASAEYVLDDGERRKRAIREDKADAFDLLVAVSESEGENLESAEKLFDAVAETPDQVEASFKGDQRLAPTIETVCARLGLGPELSSRVAEGWECGYLAARPRFNPWPQSAGGTPAVHFEARSAAVPAAPLQTPAVQAHSLAGPAPPG